MRAIVLVLRGLHLGYLGCYGNDWIDTPGLDRLAAEGIVFDQHYADCPDGAAARRAWRTGLWQSPGGHAAPEPADLVHLLHVAGVPCHLILDVAKPLSAEFTQGWDSVRHASLSKAAEASLDVIQDPIRLGLEEFAKSEQSLLWVDLAALLPPWRVPAECLDPYFQRPTTDDEDEVEDSDPLEPILEPLPGLLPAPDDKTFLRLQSTYSGAVTYVDCAVAWLLEELDRREPANDSLLIVTTDHGQALGEHGIVGPYRPWLHDELIHLPLLVRLSGSGEAGRRVAGLTQSVDLFASLLDAFGLTVPPNHGHSLWPLARGEVDHLRSFVCSGLRLGEREEWALRTVEWGLLLPVAAPADDPIRLSQIFVKPDDRWEVNDVRQHHLELAESLEKTLREFVASPRRIWLETPWTAESNYVSS